VRRVRRLTAEGTTPGRPEDYSEVGSQATHTKGHRRRGPLILTLNMRWANERNGAPSFYLINERLIVKWGRFVILLVCLARMPARFTACTVESAET
jgi:hypothetical protein